MDEKVHNSSIMTEQKLKTVSLLCQTKRRGNDYVEMFPLKFSHTQNYLSPSPDTLLFPPSLNWIRSNCCCTFRKQPDNSCGFSSKLNFFVVADFMSTDDSMEGSCSWIWIVLLSFFSHQCQLSLSLHPTKRYEVVVCGNNSDFSNEKQLLQLLAIVECDSTKKVKRTLEKVAGKQQQTTCLFVFHSIFSSFYVISTLNSVFGCYT